MRVLSLFDGMACGMIAFKVAGIPIDSYDAYEIDKFRATQEGKTEAKQLTFWEV